MTAPFPAYPLAANKSNNTPSFDDHPEHHDDIANGMNSLQEQIIHDLVHLTGDESIDGNKTFLQPVNFGGQRATNAATPTAGSDLATMSYVLSVASGTLNVRGAYDASSNLFPTTGGSGPAGAVKKGDFWICSVAGTLTTAQGAIATTPGDWIVALVDTPAQTAANWDVIEHEIGYTPANDTLVVHLAGAETVTGVKRFNTRPVTSDLAAFWSVPVDGITDASTALATVDSTTSDLNTLVIRSGETLYVNTNLTLTNIELDVKKGGLVKVGTGFTFKTAIRNSGLRTLLDVTGTPGVFVPTNQPLWHPIWWGPVLTSNDTATWKRAFAAKVTLGVAFFTLFNSGQKFALPAGISRWADLDIPDGCDVGGVMGGTLVGPAAGTVNYMCSIASWAGLHDVWVDSRSVNNKTLVWLMGGRSYFHTAYMGGSLGTTGIGIRIGQVARSFTDATITSGTTLTSPAQAVFTTQDTGLGISGTGIPGGTTMTYVSPTQVTLSATSTNGAVASTTIAATGSRSNKIHSLYCLGTGTGTGISNEASDVEWSNVWFGDYGRNVDMPYGACMVNGLHTWGATTDGIRAAGSASRYTNVYSETNGVSTGGWGMDFTGANGHAVDAYYVWANGNGIRFSTAGTRAVTDGVISGTTTLTSTQAIFSANDLGRAVTSAGGVGAIAANTTITAYSADGLTATLSLPGTNGAITTTTVGSGASTACGHIALGAGVFDDNLDTSIEFGPNTSNISVIGAVFRSASIAGGGSAVSRRGIHAAPGCTATVRALGSNTVFTQQLKVDDSAGGLDIELGRKRVVPAADFVDTTGGGSIFCSFPYGYNDEWDIEVMFVAMGSMSMDLKFRLQPTGTNCDGWFVVPSLLGSTQTLTTFDSIAVANASRMNSTGPTYLLAGLISDTINQGFIGRARFTAGTGTSDSGVINLIVAAQSTTAGGARGTPSVADATFNATTTIVSATATFVAASDPGRPISGTGIPAGAYIVSVTNPTTIVISAATTTNGSSGTPTNNTITMGVNKTTVPALGCVMTAVRRG